MKKGILFLLSIVLILMLVCVPSSFADSTGVIKDGMTWELSNGVLTISGAGAMPDYEKPEDTPWYASRESIVKLVFKGTIIRIGSNAFANCTNLAEIEFVNSISSIGKRAFYNCTALYAASSTGETRTSPKDAKELPGDVNGDGEVDGRDAIHLMKYLAEEIDPETNEIYEINEKNANVNGDDTVDERDLLRLMRYLSGENIKLQ